MLAARQAGITTIFLPDRNENDVADINDDLINDVTFIYATQVDQVLERALESVARDGATPHPQGQRLPAPEMAKPRAARAQGREEDEPSSATARGHHRSRRRRGAPEGADRMEADRAHGRRPTAGHGVRVLDHPADLWLELPRPRLAHALRARASGALRSTWSTLSTCAPMESRRSPPRETSAAAPCAPCLPRRSSCSTPRGSSPRGATVTVEGGGSAEGDASIEEEASRIAVRARLSGEPLDRDAPRLLADVKAVDRSTGCRPGLTVRTGVAGHRTLDV